MTVNDMERAAEDLSVRGQAVCWAIDVLLPVLKLAQVKASGWRIVSRLGVRVAIKLLEEYQAGRCASD